MKKLTILLLLMAQLAAMAQKIPVGQEERTAEADSSVMALPLRQLLAARLDSLCTDTLLQRTQLGLMVWDLTDDTLLYAVNSRQLLRTASTMKVLTAVTALDCLSPDYCYKTSLYYKGSIEQGRLSGDIICVGGMDPMFSRRDMQAFVEALRSKTVRTIVGRIVTDCSMKESEKWGAGWCWDDKNPVLSPLLVGGKADFADQLLKELHAAGISTPGIRVVSGKLPDGAQPLSMRSHSLDEVLKQMMKESDNLYAEATYYQIAAATALKPATAKDAQQVELALLKKLGLDSSRFRLADGSGLSLYDYLTPEAQVLLLRYAWQRPSLYRRLLQSLPVAGVDGTLKGRMKNTVAEGNVQAKTGTVTAVSALTGYLTAPNGHRLAFCIVNQGVLRASEGREFQDKVCLALCRP